MPKNIPVTLLAHSAEPASTLCYLMLIALKSGTYIGLTSLDRDVTYNPFTTDSTQPNVTQTFYAHTGADLSNFSAANDVTVNNGEAQTLTPIYPAQGISEAQIDNGDLDWAEYTIYEVNYRDLTMGHMICANGPVGEVRFVEGGLVTFECLSWSDLLRQNSVCERDSLTCRVIHFGSQPGEERYPCMYNIEASSAGPGEWITGVVVTAVGAEVVRDFTASGLGQATDYFNPGVVLWLTGDNAGMTREIDEFTAGGTIGLQFVCRHPIQVGDTFDIRRDCSRKWEGNNSCDTYNNRPYFRGEPHILTSDTIALTVPGAGSGGFQTIAV